MSLIVFLVGPDVISPTVDQCLVKFPSKKPMRLRVHCLNKDQYRHHPHIVINTLKNIKKRFDRLHPKDMHEFIAHYSKSNPNVCVITTCYDTLLEKAGCKRVVRLYGDLDHTKKDSKGKIRPNVTLVGEPMQNHRTAVQILRMAQCAVVVGFHLDVSPAKLLNEILPNVALIFCKSDLPANIDHLKETRTVKIAKNIKQLDDFLIKIVKD